MKGLGKKVVALAAVATMAMTALTGCAGTTIDKDLNQDDFAIGRVRQEIKKGKAVEYLDKKID